MLWIGLTGGLGSGKSTAAKFLRELGQVVIDADEMARLALSPGSPAFAKVVTQFGTDVLDSNGQLDRQGLGRKVFADKRLLAALESIVHPEVKKLTAERRRALEAQGSRLAFYDVPLLFEKNMQGEFAKIVVVAADRETQIRRASQRSNLTRDEVIQRLANQKPMSEKIRAADYVLDNNGTEEELKAQAAALVKKLSSLHQPQE